MKRYIVWVCQGCDACEPPDGSPRMTGPCTDTSPSMDGAEVVIVAELREQLERLRIQPTEVVRRYEQEASIYNQAIADVMAALDAGEPS